MRNFFSEYNVKFLNFQKENVTEKSATLWNALAGIINAGQSAIILIFVSHCLDIAASGVFTIAYAIGNLIYTVARYGVRNYQVTDAMKENSFGEYFWARCITTGGAFFLLLIYLFIEYISGVYSWNKVLIVFFMCLWKLVDAIEDVFYGMYQQQGYLGLGAKCYSYRLLISTLLFCILVCLNVPLLTITAVVAIVSYICAFILIKLSLKNNFKIKFQLATFSGVKKILKDCLSLCIAAVLAMYIGNAPKYMIDQYLSESVQAIFSYIMMPAFMTMLLSGFIYQPIVRNLGIMWENRKISEFVFCIWRQCIIITILTILVVAVGSIIGIPFLSFLYNVELSSFKKEFIVLLLGGGIYAIVSFLIVPITVMRIQKHITIGFIGASVCSMLCGKVLICEHGLMGACLLYLITNVVLLCFFLICFIVNIKIIKNRVGIRCKG